MPSSVIAGIDYQAENRTLLITYVSGLVYAYHGVPEKVVKELKAAGSRGRFLNFHIKGKYRFDKVSGR